MIELITNRIKIWVSLVPAAAVIPANLVFFMIVVVKKFLAIVKFLAAFFLAGKSLPVSCQLYRQIPPRLSGILIEW